jgi:hypothetical protein
MPKGLRGFQKGNPGRPKKAGGSITKSSKERLRDLFNKNIPKIFKELETLKGTPYFNALGVVAPYCLPRLSVSDIQVTSSQVDDKYKGLSIEALRKIRDIMDADKSNPDIKLLDND